ncbi:unnamed protein product [Darwinula stevensoni]|uniref:Glucose-methanol-choline oxidoreductase N-terminal domain-containing protein n=1 Tax=Darwinula stevensoni TaxID=69355 RepID=A0A7R9AEC4_9CRUS|nr:unnamed protein product [Darwinula stevensoni]CAG0902197.1 unnamed protein product [Darwinula stevensoni]
MKMGGGTTGSVIASRLTENPHVKVLLLEAGSDGTLLSWIPAAAALMWSLDKFDYRYTSEPQEDSCLALEGGRCRWPRGRMLGRSSALNGAIYIRGNHKDYDNWAALGNPGWSFNDLLPLFIRAEKFLVKDASARDALYHGTGGYFPVSHTYFTELLSPFIEAGKSLGFLHNHDYNGASQRGFSRVQVAAEEGIRYSTAKAYLTPVKHRKNLQVVLNTVVSRIVLDETTKTAKGVEYLTEGGSTRFVSAKREVILSAGAVASPQLLMLSGIGPTEELHRHGIRPIVDLRVGENMQSHTGPGGLYFSIKKKSGFYIPRLFTTDLIPSTLQYVLKGDGIVPSLSWILHAWETYKGLLFQPGFAIYPHAIQPKSRGKILLHSTNVKDHPIIIGNYFKDPADLKIAIEGTASTPIDFLGIFKTSSKGNLRSSSGIRLALRLGEQPAFKKFGAEFYSESLPGCRHLKQFTDEYWECHIRQFTYLFFHDVGTCKMGPPTDPGAVVDPALRVYGVRNLRVADASIMPVIVSGTTMAAAIVIGEKASDLIKSTHGISASSN